MVTKTMALVSALAIFPPSQDASGQVPAQWTVDSKPTVTIGASESDTTDLLTAVVGATRLPDGSILVGDNAAFALRLFSANGKAVRAFGRKGGGPGEITYLKSLLRCGDSLVTEDIDGDRVSVFSIDGKFVRLFRFGSSQTAMRPGGVRAVRPPYTSVCNRGMTFAHYGWEERSDMVAGPYRPRVPFWLSAADSSVGAQLGVFAGSERNGSSANGRIVGSMPLPLGKQTKLALAADRVYIGTADTYEILVFDLTGKPISPIRAQRPVIATTSADVDQFKAIQMSGMTDARRAFAEKQYAEVQYPTTLPAYGALTVDVGGNLWVQDYPRPTSTTVTWSVFDTHGRPVASTTLPSYLEVYEIGTDYVLGRYYDPEEAIPQVRLYRLRRT